MIKNSNNSVSRVEEVLVFYNKYLALENDDVFILNLICKLANTFIAKIPQGKDVGKILVDEEIKLTDLKFTEEDLQKLCNFEQKCIKFHSWPEIKIADDIIVQTDRYGTIAHIHTDITELRAFEGKNIFELTSEINDVKALKDAENVIMQNILVSKIYKAIKETICAKISKQSNEKDARNYGVVFTLVNNGIINYEKELINKNLKITQINNGFARTRSTR